MNIAKRLSGLYGDDMTESKLLSVWTCQKKIEELNKRLQIFKDFRMNITKTITGMPNGRSYDSRLESSTVNIVQTESELEAVQAEMEKCQIELINYFREKLTDRECNLMLLRYVACQKFKEIASVMGYSEKRIFQLHKSAKEKCVGELTE